MSSRLTQENGAKPDRKVTLRTDSVKFSHALAVFVGLFIMQIPALVLMNTLWDALSFDRRENYSPFTGWQVIRSQLTDGNSWAAAVFCASALSIGQLLFVLPVLTPQPRAKHPGALNATLLVVGVNALVLLAPVLALTIGPVLLRFDPASSRAVVLGLCAIILIGAAMVVRGIITIAKRRRPTYERALFTVARLLLAANVLTLIAVCVYQCWHAPERYSSQNAYPFAVTAFVGAMLSAGSALFICFLDRTRQPYWRTHCTWCGYDLSGVPTQSPCPECGTARPQSEVVSSGA